MNITVSPPEGHFFRLGLPSIISAPYLELRRERRFLGFIRYSEYVAGIWQYHTEFSSVEEEVNYLAASLIHKYEKQLAEARRVRQILKVSGDYGRNPR